MFSSLIFRWPPVTAHLAATEPFETIPKFRDGITNKAELLRRCSLKPEKR